jgi:hypothetical protein
MYDRVAIGAMIHRNRARITQAEALHADATARS